MIGCALPEHVFHDRDDGTFKGHLRQLAGTTCGVGEIVVFGVPMHNFGVPSVLKLWIDQIARVGKTFSYADGKPKGLIIGKKATFVVATGGIYDAQTQMASFNFVEPYLRSLFGFLGLTDVTFLTAGGTMALNHGQDLDAFLAPHLQAVQTQARSLDGVTV